MGVTNIPTGRKLPPRRSHPKVCFVIYFLTYNGYSSVLRVVRAAKVESPIDAHAEELLAHAKVYHLAHYKAIDPLRAMALGHVDRVLSEIDPVNSPVGSVTFVDFIRYVYANTDHLDHHEEPLRSLVSNFVARNFNTLRSAPAIAKLLSEGGDIVMDVMVAVSRGPSLSLPSAASVALYPTRYIQWLQVSRHLPTMPQLLHRTNPPHNCRLCPASSIQTFPTTMCAS